MEFYLRLWSEQNRKIRIIYGGTLLPKSYEGYLLSYDQIGIALSPYNPKDAQNHSNIFVELHPWNGIVHIEPIECTNKID